MAENEKELKNTFMRLIDETEKAGLKLGIQKKNMIVATSSITSLQTE